MDERKPLVHGVLRLVSGAAHRAGPAARARGGARLFPHRASAHRPNHPNAAAAATALLLAAQVLTGSADCHSHCFLIVHQHTNPAAAAAALLVAAQVLTGCTVLTVCSQCITTRVLPSKMYTTTDWIQGLTHIPISAKLELFSTPCNRTSLMSVSWS
jgi:hypothetical protein